MTKPIAHDPIYWNADRTRWARRAPRRYCPARGPGRRVAARVAHQCSLMLRLERHSQEVRRCVPALHVRHPWPPHSEQASKIDQGGVRTQPWTGLGCISEFRAVLHGTA
jgi:hypothetical protein